MTSKRFWIVLFPDVSHPAGGVLQLHRFATILTQLKCEVYLVQDDVNFQPPWFSSSLNTISAASWQFGRNLDPRLDMIILPETYVHRIKDFNASIPKIIFNQNTSYTFGLPATKNLFRVEKIIEYYSRPDIAFVLCVSSFDRDFLVQALHIPFERVHIIPNYVAKSKFNHLACNNKIITYMPRKNFRDAYIVKSLIQHHPSSAGWSFKAIHNMPHDQVLHEFSESILYLSFGNPEGFGLPCAEALASGNALIGYSGLGGREIFNSVDAYGVCWEIQTGDYLAFLRKFVEFSNSISSDPALFNSYLKSSANHIADIYSRSSMMQSASRFLSTLNPSAVD